MSARTFCLPLRALSRSQFAQQAERYTCRRCLHTTQSQAQAATSATTTTTTDAQAQAQAPVIPPSSASAPTKPGQEYNAALTFSQRDYSLSKTDRLVKRILPHSIRPQLLQYVDPAKLHGREREVAEKSYKHHEIVGVVVRAGRMDKTVTVRIAGRKYEPRIKKYFANHTQHLVHDPNNSLAQGDVVSLHRLRVSSAVHHVVASIITPFGTPIDSRPPIPTPSERLAAYKAKRLDKLHRRSLRRAAAEGDVAATDELKAAGLDPGAPNAPLGSKGQKLPKGVLPGGKHEVGKIDARAKANKQAAIKRQAKADANRAKAAGLDG